MPDLEYRSNIASPSVVSPETATAESDLQDTVGNEALASLIASGNHENTNEVDALWEEAAAEQAVQKPNLRAGIFYQIQDADMADGAMGAWRNIAKDHGMTEDLLMAFNPHIQSTQSTSSGPVGSPLPESQDLAVGVQLYIPSSDDILFKQCTTRASSMSEAVELWNELEGSHNVEMMRHARSRASGKVGVGYGTGGDGGIFYSPNIALNGASSKRSEEVNGQTEYRVNWGADFWKCSVFLHDVTYAAGYQPHVQPNNHYLVAGRLQESPDYEEVPVERARPGDCWQRFGGTRSDESHNAILSSFVEVEPLDEHTDRWTFSIIGAETDRAAESERTHRMKAATNENTAGKIIRFFRPKAKRTSTA